MISASEVVATLGLLIPGFIALKIFQVLALPVKRSDLEWTLWSLITAVPIAATAASATPDAGMRIVIGVSIGVLVGLLLWASWLSIPRLSPDFWARFRPSAWDHVMTQAGWIQVWTTRGDVISGSARFVGLGPDTDERDIYLIEPAWVTNEDVTVIDGVDGMLIKAAAVNYVQFLTPVSASPFSADTDTEERR